MRTCLKRFRILAILGAAGLAGVLPVSSGGSGRNVVVVVNQTSRDSVRLGNYYAERRSVPPQNILRINWTGGNTDWTVDEMQSTLLGPLLQMVSGRGLSNQVDFVVLSMDIPPRVNIGGDRNSTTSVVYYGYKTNSNPASGIAPGSENSYAFSERPFRQSPPATADHQPFLCFMITGSNLPLAQLVVDQGVSSDGTFPTAWVVLEKTFDPDRNVRYVRFDDAIFDLRLIGRPATRIESDNVAQFTGIAGLETGLMAYDLPSNVFVPGSIGDTLTSYGGSLFVPNDQTTVLEWLQAGATGSYGTVIEPFNYLEKFPDPLDYFYQGRGFNLAESYYQSVANPYQGLMVGEPLASPFRVLGRLLVSAPAPDAILQGNTSVAGQMNAADANHPIDQLDFYIDGVFHSTVTNIVPQRGNQLSVQLRNQTIRYTVGTNETRASVASNLASTINQQRLMTHVTATNFGDRVELMGEDPDANGLPTPFSVSSQTGTAAELTTFVRAAQPAFLDSNARGILTARVSGNPSSAATLTLTVTKTNQAQVTVSVSNNGANLPAFVAAFIDAINNAASLQGADGLVAEDLLTVVQNNLVQFHLRARSGGWSASRIKAQVTASPPLAAAPPASTALQENAADLLPRQQLFVTSGSTQRNFQFSLNTTALADGFHQLAWVGREGSSPQTQSQTNLTVQVQNHAWNVSFTIPDADTASAEEATMHPRVAVTGTGVQKIQLFTTGGLFAETAGESVSQFAVPGSYLAPGLHLFYAIVQSTAGTSYRTETKTIRVLPKESAVRLQMLSSGVLSFPVVAGRRYQILSTDVLGTPLQVRADFVANATGTFVWTDPSPASIQRFYEVRVP